ncbi:SDR family NAD(P)-dependent oxidoreductase [Cocleimonas sp. KMM 6892]|uniref:SDR family NAD(P)-dependent oxidoreductase n=1 Tax=unclassified Cocleimonas TaxID=2639732 RepID=UPI002DBD9473|nr:MULTISPECIES: SDR family oxidoreductase [unclassified Cocleimonas]MEB8431388.1 SDR family NAD(P)-dependent oxidoreductase [Cocleimonas sp. KMM 6892]MEC4713840.1 SDR family NAD(P)-dependent oxidoreductase [Cocleimonas sp. KMM 6895]MEC4743171.1 SDR family NAD(P)-dependent oxidoreductase [Cocleimonas sp. KMM 6896]
MNNNGFSSDLLVGKTVVITGAGRGIGLAIATTMKECGAKLIAHSGRSGTAKSLVDIADSVFEADMTDENSVRAFIEFVKAETSTIDVLINNAGTMLGRFPADELTSEQYQNLVNLNQTSVVQITRALIPSLRQSSGASIINTVSISATTGGSPGSSIYSATKAFVSTYTKALARELAPDNIRANAVSPGTITTDFHKRYSSEEKLEATRLSIPLQRLGLPEDCAPAYVFLSSEKLSGYITGQVLEINGGQLIA